MKQTLRWLIYSILFGAIITVFGSPQSFQEWVGLWICGTVFFLGMLINMLDAKEK
jgi:heme A synthase